MKMKTDSELQQDVLAQLKFDPSINAAHIGVEVDGGVVTLAGKVDSYFEKVNAERAAQRVSGVSALAIEIDVAIPGPYQRTDADIARNAASVLQWMTNLPKDSVKVMVDNGIVTLSGELSWQHQRLAAADAVRFLGGVVGVNNSIAIKPAVSTGAVKTEIEAALKRQANVDAGRISVKVSGSEVTLSGTVHSWAERNLVAHSAWGTPGVRNVVDQTTLSYY
jgi:osmotically-inducible protein OsmY